jgi:streptogramin lyase
MLRGMLGAMAVFVLAVSAGAASAVVTPAAEEKGRYIVVFEDWVEHPAALARLQTEEAGSRLGFVYRYALNGYSAELTPQAVGGLRRNPQVRYVVADGQTEDLAQETPTGIARVFVPPNKTLDIDGVDDLPLDVDIAVIDGGVNAHEDLIIAKRTNCTVGPECVDGTGFDTTGHGTWVAGVAGAMDNGVGVVGTAPGARIWSVKTSEGQQGLTSWRLAGIDWVIATQTDGDPDNDIEVANMSFACPNQCPPPTPFDQALANMVAVGVVPVVAAGNGNVDLKNTSPANAPDALAVSGISDYDGKPGGLSSSTCVSSTSSDDARWVKSGSNGSNFGPGVDVAAPAGCIKSTASWAFNGYGPPDSGTSVAAPHVAGAAAVLAAQEIPQSKADVEAIEETIERAGNLNWTDTSLDGIHEPLLDMSNELIFWGWAPTPTFFTNVGSLGSGNGQFNSPADVEVDPATGDLLVADQNNHRIQRLNSKGEYLSQFGSNGSANGQFKSPRSVAVDSSGNIWVADQNNHRIQKFTSSGTHLKTCGSEGTGPGQFSAKGPKAIAVGAEDNVWVTDYSNRVLKFNYNCSYVTSITGFSETAGIDIAAEKIWVTDWSADKVKVYSEKELVVPLFQISATGSGFGQLNGPDGVEVDSKGNVWVLETENDRIQQFNQAGKYRSQFGTGVFTVNQSVSLTSDGKGSIWFAHNTGNRLQKWVVPIYAPTLYASVGSTGSGNGQFNSPADVEVEPGTGELLIADQNNNRIQRFNSKGAYLSQFGTTGSADGQFKSPRSVAIDANGHIWVADSGNHRVQKFTANGTYLRKCGSQGSGNGQFSSKGPKTIAVDATNNVWVTDYSGRVQKFNTECVFQTSITGFSESAGIDIAAGKIWVTDWSADKVKVYNESGVLQFQVGTVGSGLGRLNGPDGVEVDSKGNVWVLETENDRVQQFSEKAGEYRSQFGAGQFTVTQGVSLTSDGKGGLWLAHNSASRLQKWLVPRG